jgi:hypothetical protein
MRNDAAELLFPDVSVEDLLQNSRFFLLRQLFVLQVVSGLMINYFLRLEACKDSIKDSVISGCEVSYFSFSPQEIFRGG